MAPGLFAVTLIRVPFAKGVADGVLRAGGGATEPPAVGSFTPEAVARRAM